MKAPFTKDTWPREDRKKHPSWSDARKDRDEHLEENLKEALLGSYEDFLKRGHLLNLNHYQDSRKGENKGMMPNIKDPYPVDNKIEELELHKPRVKAYECVTHVHGESSARLALTISDSAEKRIVKLENMLATLYRLVFRLGTRLPINCVYYGGQTPFEKYKGIRCLKDNRIEDAMVVSIDQCLYCTRFEPVHGQCYEILNDLGRNVSAVLDDNQMGYSSMKEARLLHRTEEILTDKEKAHLDISRILLKDKESALFTDTRGEGIRMNWNLVPLENEVPHINKRQSILDDGSLLRLSSYQGSNLNEGYNAVLLGSNILSHVRAMDTYKGGDALVMWAIEEGKKAVRLLSITLGAIKEGLEVAFSEERAKDPLLMCALTMVLGRGASGPKALTKSIETLLTDMGTTNLSMAITAYGTGLTAFLGDEKKAPHIKDVCVNVKNAEDKRGTCKPKLSWDKRNHLLFTDYAEYVAEGIRNGYARKEGLALFPKCAYLYKAILPHVKKSTLDTDIFAFPFSEEELRKGIWYTSSFGPRGSGFHHGIDLADNGGGTPCRAIADGIVVSGLPDCAWDSYNTAVIINHEIHGTKYYSRYLHGDPAVRVGDRVKQGDIVTYMASHGHSTGPHLHFEIGYGEGEKEPSSNTDPLSFYPKWSTNVGERLPSI